MASYWKELIELQTSQKTSRKRPREGNARMESFNRCRAEMRSRRIGESFQKKAETAEKVGAEEKETKNNNTQQPDQ